jgi:hypothetical protein
MLRMPGKIVDLLADIPTLAVARERLALAQDEIKRLEAENERLRKENVALWTRVEAITPPEFVEASGVLWRRRAAGAVEPIAYCPNCRLAMSAFPPGSNELLACSKCDFVAPFRPRELSEHLPA